MSNSKASDLSVALVGDVNLGTPIDPHIIFDHVKGDFEKFDVRFCNLEGCLFDPKVELEYKSGWHHCDRANIKALAELKFNAAACANNVHFGEDAIRNSLSLLDKHNIVHAGAGMNYGEARRPAIFEADGTKFGLLAYTSVFWPIGHAATENRAGVATVKIHTSYQPHRRLVEMPGAPATTITYPDEKEFEEMKSDIRNLRGKVDLLVVYYHWGVSGSQEICQYQRTLGRTAIDLGADLVMGSHPHVVQGIEFYREKPIFYSLGNFVFGSGFAPVRKYRTGMVAVAEVRNRRVERVFIVPSVVLEKDRPALLTPDQADSRPVVDNINRLCAEFGTKMTREGSRFLVERS